MMINKNLIFVDYYNLQYIDMKNKNTPLKDDDNDEQQYLGTELKEQKKKSGKRQYDTSNNKDRNRNIQHMISQNKKIICLAVVVVVLFLFLLYLGVGKNNKGQIRPNLFANVQNGNHGNHQNNNPSADFNSPKIQDITLSKHLQTPTPTNNPPNINNNKQRLPAKSQQKISQTKKIKLDDQSFLNPNLQSQSQKMKQLHLKSELHNNRNNLFQKKIQLQYLKYAKYNMQIQNLQNNRKVMQQQLKEQQDNLHKKYGINNYNEEISLCVVVYDDKSDQKRYSQQYVLNSIYNQQYTNYIVIYIADGYPEDNLHNIKTLIKQKNNKNNTVLLWNSVKKSFLESVYYAIKNQCTDKKITALIGGDDELLGRQTFKLLNAVYRNSNVNLVYSNFIEFHPNQKFIKLGFAKQYEEQQKKDNKYRDVGQKFGSLKSFKTRLLTYILEKDLKDTFRNFYTYAGDYALMFPLLQLSCGKVMHVPQSNYLYYGYNVDPVYGSLQVNIGRQIRRKQKYDCFKDFNK